MKGKFLNPETGKVVSGAAAQQMIIRHDGGWDEHHRKFAMQIADTVSNHYLNELERDVRKVGLRLVE